MGKGKGKVQSDEQKQAIVIFAARTQRAIRKINAVLALLFVAALAYMFVVTAMALLNTGTRIPDPEPFGMPRSAIPETAALAADTVAVDLDLSSTLRDHGFAVLSPDDIRREPVRPVKVDDQQPQRPPTQTPDAFNERIRQGDEAMNQRFDYARAVQLFETAAGMPEIPPFRREEAGAMLERAQVFLTITQGILPLAETNRIVRYTPPARQNREPIIAAVARTTRNWQVGTILVSRLSDDALIDLAVTNEWKVEELRAEDIRREMAARIAARLKELRQLKGDGLAEPLDFVRAAIVILESGSVEMDGSTIHASALAHACLGEAYDICRASNCSLSHSVLLRRDPEYLNYMTLQTHLTSLDRRIARASDAELPAAEAAMRQGLVDARRILGALYRRYPRAWEFRDHGAGDTLDRLQESLHKRADERARKQADQAADAATPAPAPPSNEIDELIAGGAAAEKRGDDLVASTRSGTVNLHETLSQAIERYQEALVYYRKARDLATTPAQRASIERLVTEVNRSIYWARKSMPLRRH